MSSRDKWVRRFSVDETAKHKNGFTVYKITSVLFPIDSPEAVTVVSVWKRYSDIQQLHKSMKALHAGLHLRGTFPALAKSSYFKRFQQEVIEERVKSIKELLEFVAEHKLLFTSTDFVNFLQSGYPDVEPKGVINTIRTSLQLPIEDAPPLEYQTSDDDSRSPESQNILQPASNTSPDSNIPTDISQIPIYEPVDVEIRESPTHPKTDSNSNSFGSLNSLDSIGSDLYDELSKVTINKIKPFVKNNVLPDLIIFDAPSTSRFDDYHTMPRDESYDDYRSRNFDQMSINSTMISTNLDSLSINSDRTTRNVDSLKDTISFDTVDSLKDASISFDSSSLRSASFGDARRSSARSALSLSVAACKTRTEDSYVFEAGYLLNLAARCEDVGDFQRAFECYKSGIEKMLIGVQSDSDPERRALIKEKTNKYLSYAEEIYRRHLSGPEQSLLPEREEDTLRAARSAVPPAMLRRDRAELAQYRVLAVLGRRVTLVLREAERACCAMKVIQKVPHNQTEFDNYFQRPETREPILPTLIPYMVPLLAYVETPDLIFLILSYAPGQKLFDYIKNYAKSVPNTPRRVNLENVFPKEVDLENNIESGADCNSNEDMSVKELVVNSHKLLLDVERVLADGGPAARPAARPARPAARPARPAARPARPAPAAPAAASVTFLKNQRDVLPPSTICKWGAEILTALESLHNAGVICRDLNPSNILLSEGGQVILTYFTQFGPELPGARLRGSHYEAPELYSRVCFGEGGHLDRVCDFWSFGAIMYELICGVPLSHHHPTTFTSHTILQLPEGLSVEVESLLTQLLTYEPAERLGGGPGGIHEIKEHPYFKHIDWQHVYNSWIVPD